MSVVLLLFAGCLIGHRLFHLLRGVVPRHHRCYGGPGEAVVETLDRGQGHPKGGHLRVKEPPASVGLHHSDAHIRPLAELV